jgi:copper oxidase (laccase) domain-containing protein
VKQAFVSADAQANVAFLPNINAAGKYFADIYSLARLRLRSQGIDKISGGGF